MPGSLNVIGAQVRKFREAAGYTQSELVARCQVLGLELSRVALGMLETGRRSVADYEVHFLARALRVQLAELYPVTVKAPKRKLRNPRGPTVRKRTRKKPRRR